MVARRLSRLRRRRSALWTSLCNSALGALHLRAAATPPCSGCLVTAWQQGRNASSSLQPTRPLAAAEAKSACSGLFSGPERSALAAWTPKWACGLSLDPVHTRQPHCRRWSRPKLGPAGRSDGAGGHRGAVGRARARRPRCGGRGAGARRGGMDPPRRIAGESCTRCLCGASAVPLQCLCGACTTSSDDSHSRGGTEDATRRLAYVSMHTCTACTGCQICRRHSPAICCSRQSAVPRSVR